MRCEICGNNISELFLYDGKRRTCRYCIEYKKRSLPSYSSSGRGEYYLNYSLTESQKEASNFLVQSIKNKQDCVLRAVTGAGKTEIIYPLIRYCIINNLKIGIAIPRKDVVIELFGRIKKDFKAAKVTSVYGGNNKELVGDVVILTTHQLYRYDHYFDVVVIDEVDAFPFHQNVLLNNFLINSKKGNIVYMSATIPKELQKDKFNIYSLNKRYHGEKLDIPKVKYYWGMINIKKYIKKHRNSIIIIYFPTIKDQIKFSKKLKIKHIVVNSKVDDRAALLNELHKLESGVILSTLILERGITFKNTNVIVCKADSKLFSFENLVQISGRVGRSFLFPHGDIIFMVDWKNKKIKRVIKFIRGCNE